MVVTMGGDGALYVDKDGSTGIYPARKVDVVDTTGAGDAFFSGVCIGLTYGKSLRIPAGSDKTCSDRDLYFGEYLPEIYAGRIWSCAVG